MISSVEELREQLKRERNRELDNASQAIDGTGTDSKRVSGSDVRQKQSIPTDLSGSSTENDSINESYNDSERGSNQIAIGRRPTNRRFGKDSFSTSSDSKGIRGPKRRAGKLVADDPIPNRYEKETINDESSRIGNTTIETDTTKEKKSVTLPSRKQTTKSRSTTTKREIEEQDDTKGFKIPWFKEGTKLTDSEVVALEAPLIAALEADLYYVDQFIWLKTQDTSQAPIWSDMDTDDLTVMARVMLKQGKRSPQAATMVRSIVGGSDYISALMLTVPRVIRTVDAYKRAPKKPKMSFVERKRAARGIE